MKRTSSVLFNGDDDVVLAGFGHASFHPPRGQFLQGNIAVSIAHVSLVSRWLVLTDFETAPERDLCCFGKPIPHLA